MAFLSQNEVSMVQIDVVYKWGVLDFMVTEGTIISGYDKCAWCKMPADVEEIVLAVQERGRTEKFVLHPKCLPPEVKAARKLALGIAQVEYNRAPQRV